MYTQFMRIKKNHCKHTSNIQYPNTPDTDGIYGIKEMKKISISSYINHTPHGSTASA